MPTTVTEKPSMIQSSVLSFFHKSLGANKVPEPEETEAHILSGSLGHRSQDASSEESFSQSLTPPTSVTDTVSSAFDATRKPAKLARASQRLRHSLSNISSYNEAVLRGTARKGRRQTIDTISRNVSGETLIADENGDHENFVEETVRPLSRDFDIGPLPGDDLKMTATPKPEVTRRKSTRIGVFEKASTALERTNDAMDRTKSVLGKRGRSTVEAGLGTLRMLKGLTYGKQTREEDCSSHVPSFEGPVAKRARLSEKLDEQLQIIPPREAKPEARQRSRKRYLAQGLYVGQHKDFNPRLTETKNRLKSAFTTKDERGKHPLLPLPMFAGQRVMENGRPFKLPFDVFSPLPPGQPKPDEWKKRNKNVFVGEAAEIWRKPEKLAQSRCLCTATTGCNEDCHNRLMLYECDSSNCTLTHSECGNRAFADLQARAKAGGKYRIGVEVCKTTDRGHGVRANRMFEPNQIIIEYTGEVITQEECETRMRKRYHDAECYYLMDFDQSMILDATRGSIARFINHSCEPNCKMVKWTVAGKPRMALFAGDEGIMTGEELTYDYNFDPYSTKNVQECRCGTASCRGVLGPKPKDIKDALKPIIGNKRKLGDVVSESMNAVKTQSKKRKIAVASGVKSAFANAKASAGEKLASASEEASNALASAKASASSKLQRARSMAVSSTTLAAAATAKASEKERLVKRVSVRSLKGTGYTKQSSSTEQSTGSKDQVKRRHTIVTYSCTCPPSAPGCLANPINQKQKPGGKVTDYVRIPSNPVALKNDNAVFASDPDAILRKARGKHKAGGSTEDKEEEEERTLLGRSQSLKEKVGSLRKNVVRTVKRRGPGAEAGNPVGSSSKTIRVIED